MALASTPALAQNAGVGGPNATALIYHRFGETDYPSTNIRMEQFEAHVEELASGAYNVVTLGTVAAALQAGEALPERTVAISVDDAYTSVYTRAFPLLQEKGLPFTLFVATDPVDRSLDGYMSWDQLRELAAAGVEIGSQAVTHPHMPTQSAVRNRRELVRSADRLEEELGVRPTLFAYPYGEASAEIMRLTREAGYDAAFGQHSGAIGPTLDRFYLPRFPVNEAFGGMDRFRRVVNSLPLPVTDLTPDDPFLGAAGGSDGTDGPKNPPAFGFTLAETGAWTNALACYHSAVGRVEDMERLGPRIELRFARPFPPGRTRINCTAPGADGRWRWFGMQYYVAP
ncbi:MAG: polysaccharide deacetylase family protein [Marivibrio sp.]|uniref:polysaccharide deacetylase family protein n=1 Tax=Marivibrio sp. TaxID=2039719 RepID=UPI0032ECCB36